LITSDIKFTRSRVKRYNYKSIFEVARIVIYGVLSIQSGQNGAPLVLHWTALMSSCSASIKGYSAGPILIIYLFGLKTKDPSGCLRGVAPRKRSVCYLYAPFRTTIARNVALDSSYRNKTTRHKGRALKTLSRGA